jgi:hypothetical protein
MFSSISSSNAPQIGPEFLNFNEDIDIFFQTGDFGLFLGNLYSAPSSHLPSSNENDSLSALTSPIVQNPRAALEQALASAARLSTVTNDNQLSFGTLEGFINHFLVKSSGKLFDLYLVSCCRVFFTQASAIVKLSFWSPLQPSLRHSASLTYSSATPKQILKRLYLPGEYHGWKIHFAVAHGADIN